MSSWNWNSMEMVMILTPAPTTTTVVTCSDGCRCRSCRKCRHYWVVVIMFHEMLPCKSFSLCYLQFLVSVILVVVMAAVSRMRSMTVTTTSMMTATMRRNGFPLSLSFVCVVCSRLFVLGLLSALSLCSFSCTL